jgi:hypothetical protein
MRLTLLAMLLSPMLALAQSADAELQRCARLPEAASRLACYDALAASQRTAAQPLQAAPAVQAAPAPIAVSAAPVAPPTAAQKQEAFGAPVVAAKDQLDAIESRIEGLVDGWEAGTLFTLANGQRWMIADGSRAAMNLRNPKVTIRRGALGTFRIEFEGSNQTARVKRL